MTLAPVRGSVTPVRRPRASYTNVVVTPVCDVLEVCRPLTVMETAFVVEVGRSTVWVTVLAARSMVTVDVVALPRMSIETDSAVTLPVNPVRRVFWVPMTTGVASPAVG